MTDIVERLRLWPERRGYGSDFVSDGTYTGAICDEAADEIEGMVQVCDSYAVENQRFHDRIEELTKALERCRTVLGNMALENEGAIFNRWPINHEPLRNDARHLLPIIDAALEERKT